MGQEDATRIHGCREWVLLLQTAASPVCGGQVLYWLQSCTQWPQNPIYYWACRNWPLSLLGAETRTQGPRGCSASIGILPITKGHPRRGSLNQRAMVQLIESLSRLGVGSLRCKLPFAVGIQAIVKQLPISAFVTWGKSGYFHVPFCP